MNSANLFELATIKLVMSGPDIFANNDSFPIGNINQLYNCRPQLSRNSFPIGNPFMRLANEIGLLPVQQGL
jgi:hypothetical protein